MSNWKLHCCSLNLGILAPLTVFEENVFSYSQGTTLSVLLFKAFAQQALQ